MSNTMTYGAYSFIPMPMMNITREYHNNPNGDMLGAILNVTLDGTLININDATFSLTGVMGMQSGLLNAVKINGSGFVVKHDSIILFSGTPIYSSINFSDTSDHWSKSSKYNIQFTIPDLSINYSGNYLSELNEDWSFEFLDDRAYYSGISVNPYVGRLTHNVSAKGLNWYGPSGYQHAKNIVTSLLGYDYNKIYQGGVINFMAVGNTSAVNHIRSVQDNPKNNSYSVAENWLILGSSTAATEDYTVSLKESVDSSIKSINIDGTIQGYETRNYSGSNLSITTSKYAAASGYFNSISGSLYNRAMTIGGISDLHITPMSKSIGYNTHNGTINYNYEYNNRSYNCVANALNEIIVINDTNPQDVVAKINVPGRLQGPVLQSFGTKTEHIREVSVEISVPITNSSSISALLSSPRTDVVTGILQPIQNNLTGIVGVGQVFLSHDVESWTPHNGKYSRNVAWTWQSVSDTTTPSVAQ
jgi:hypothetical protein